MAAYPLFREKIYSFVDFYLSSLLTMIQTDIMEFKNNVSENFNAIGLVVFKDTLEENPDEHFGILFENGFILCLCCGAYVELGNYEIVKNYKRLSYLDDTLKMYY